MSGSAEMTGFREQRIETRHGTIFARCGGKGPPVLLLHGFPQTHLMWRGVAPLLASNFTIIAADLPGYGLSSCPPDESGHVAMSKRRMAQTLAEAMERLGHSRFAVAGHDRGGRVAYRMALDHPSAVTRVSVLDVIPTFDVWDRADANMALAFWPFSLLAQPEPLPERLIGAVPEAVVGNALECWGSSPGVFPPDVRQAYVDALRDPAHVHAICEEYRAAAGIDRDDDEADLASGRRIDCPVLCLWSGKGGLASWYEDAGGPLGLWRRWAPGVRGQSIDAGHFFPEETPPETAGLLRAFLSDSG